MRNTLLALLCLAGSTLRAAQETYHIDISRPYSYGTTTSSTTSAHLAWLAGRFGLFNSSELTLTAKGTYKLQAAYPDSTLTATTFTCGTGHWFTLDGTPCSTSHDSGRAVAVKISDGDWVVTHRQSTSSTEVTKVGDVIELAELIIYDTDTLRYEFTITLTDDDTPESVTNDQTEAYYHRDDQNEDLGVTAIVQRNDGTRKKQNWIQVNVGDRITLDAMVTDTTTYDSVQVRWNDPSGTMLRTYDSAPYVLTESATASLGGEYTMRAKRYLKGTKRSNIVSYVFYVDVQESPGEFLSWDGMIPTFGYNFKDEYGEIEEPQNILGDVADTEYGRMSDGWWTVAWGKNLNPAVGVDATTNEDTKNAMANMLDKFNEDFAYIRDEMGWPPDLRARSGYKSTILVYGSGLSTDAADSTATGGWQGATYYEGTSWPCVLASYYPVSRFRDDADDLWTDGDYQREAMIHEGIHATFADMEGVKNSAWFHEAGNTWLQSAMAVRRSGTYGTPGYLDGCPFLAPFMPIECYSGWLQDGSFGGPSAEGVNMYDGSQQICTWRTYLGGTQYGNSFPIILSEMCGDESIAWIWRYCKNRVLEGIGDSIGDDMMRRLIVQYRARQAIFDIGGWTTGYRKITSDYFGNEYGPEWEPYYIDCGKWKATCYQRMRINDSEGWLAPDDETTPGWSGANIIPIHVDTSLDSVRIQFRPEDTEERALLCYKTQSGTAYYSQMVRCGDMVIDITDTPANGVIFVVVCNTDYVYTGEEQRCNHWDYRIRLCEGALGVADKDIKWFFNENTLTDDSWEDLSYLWETVEGVEDLEEDDDDDTGEADAVVSMEGSSLLLVSTVVEAGGTLRVLCKGGIDPTDVSVTMVGLQGMVVDSGRLSESGTYRLPSSLRHGLYLLTFTSPTAKQSYKVIVR